MNAAAIGRLLQINRRFYEEHGHDFSETRLRLQPGVRRLIETLRGDESVLDLGCGNGELARALARQGHRAAYVGVDFSSPILEAAHLDPSDMPARFVHADLLALSAQRKPAWATPPALAPAPGMALSGHDLPATERRWDVIAAFAVLHHVPGREHRLELLRTVRAWLRPDGRFFLSNWQFRTNPRLQARIQSWSVVGLTQAQLDPTDCLLDWRHGSVGLRYVHQFDEEELDDLAAASGFTAAETFYSDGADHRSGLYQVWKPG